MSDGVNRWNECEDVGHTERECEAVERWRDRVLSWGRESEAARRAGLGRMGLARILDCISIS